MLRISSSSLRFVLLVYVYVHSRRQSRTFLELLASTHRNVGAYILRISSSGLRFVLLVYVYVHSRRQSRTFLELLASTHRNVGMDLLRNTAL